MARCGCVSECNCVITAGDCITVAGNGNPGAPYVINSEVDPLADNQLVCNVDGLYVQPPAAGDCISVDTAAVPAEINVVVDPAVDNELVCNPTGLYVPPPEVVVADTDCIDLGGVGTAGDPITADPIVSPDVDNLLECVASPDPNQGLRAKVNVTPTNCVDISGAGTLGDPIIPSLVISPDGGNTLECRANGAYVPTVALGAVDMRATIVDSGLCPVALPAAAINIPSNVFLDYDTVIDNVGLVPHLCGATGAYPHTSIEVPAGGAGVYHIVATHPAWSTAPTSTGDLITRIRLWKGTTAGGAADGIGQSGAVRHTTTGGTNYNTPYLIVSRTITLAVADVIAVDFVAEDYAGAFAGATLDVGPTYGNATGAADSGYAFFQMTRIGTP